MTGTTQAPIAVILNKVETVAAGFSRMEGKIDSIDLRVQAIEKNNIETTVINAARLDAAFKKIDDHDSRLKEVEKLMPVLKLFAWVASILGGSVVILIWSLITGQAQIILK